MRPRSIASLIVLLGAASCDLEAPKEDRHSRTFRFEYKTRISDFPTHARKARVWLPLPTSDEAQTVANVRVEAPIAHRLGKDAVYGNELIYLEVEAPFPEELPITITMSVTRQEVDSLESLPGSPHRGRLLAGDQLAPLNEEAMSRATRATRGRSDAVGKARGIYDQVLTDVDYDKSGKGWGRGSLEYVCEAGKGNCSDFHTLFIAMARSEKIPALFEIGFPLPRDAKEGTIGGYHCWAWYHDDNGRWRPVDASEADKDPSRAEYFFGTIDENRVAFSRGRDLILDPPQSGGPVNFLVYPHVEVDGEPGRAKVEKSFRFRDESSGIPATGW